MPLRLRLAAALVLAIAAGHSPAAADPAARHYLGATTELFAAPTAGAEPLGKILVAAPVEVTRTDEGGWVELRPEGWVQAGAPRAVQAAAGIRVLRAALTPAGAATLDSHEARDDPDTGQHWLRVSMRGWVQGAELSPEIAPIWARAEALFASRCTQCHVRRVPDRYSANQWTAFLKVMGPRTGLPQDAQFLIRAYLQHRSSDADVLNWSLEGTDR